MRSVSLPPAMQLFQGAADFCYVTDIMLGSWWGEERWMWLKNKTLPGVKCEPWTKDQENVRTRNILLFWINPHWSWDLRESFSQLGYSFLSIKWGVGGFLPILLSGTWHTSCQRSHNTGQRSTQCWAPPLFESNAEHALYLISFNDTHNLRREVLLSSLHYKWEAWDFG